MVRYRNLFWDFQSTANKMVHQAEESPGLAFFWKQEIKGRSWIGRSQKVSASGVCHKCGQVMEEKSFCKHQRMRHRPALNHGKHCVDDIKGQREAGDSYRKWNLIYQCVSLQLPLVSKYSHVQFKSVYVYVYAYHMCVYIDIISVQGENLYQKGIICISHVSVVLLCKGTVLCSAHKKRTSLGFKSNGRWVLIKNCSTLSSAIIEDFHLCSQTVLMVYPLSSEVISHILYLI